MYLQPGIAASVGALVGPPAVDGGTQESGPPAYRLHSRDKSRLMPFGPLWDVRAGRPMTIAMTMAVHYAS